MFKFSEYGVKNIEAYSIAYSGFINWCKTKVKSGIFSTYMDGEPVCISGGIEISYRAFLANSN